jgi:folate-binding protein YgfZ
MAANKMSTNVLTQFEKTRNVSRERASQSDNHSARAAYAPSLSLAEQHSVLASRVGLVDRSSLTKLKLAGKDSVDLLQRLSTNDLRTFVPGSCVYTVLTTEKGRVIDLVTLYHLSDSEIILICHAPREKVVSWIERFIIMEDVSLSDITEAYSMFSLIGPDIEKILPILGASDLQSSVTKSVIEVKVGGSAAVLGGAEPISTSVANILVPIDDADTIWKKLLDEGPSVGLRACSPDALEIHRIERGFPVYGRELTGEVNPLEAGLERFVSFTKGCFIGQEVIARLDTYKKLQKRLMGLLLADDSDVTQGARIAALGNDVGWVTSAAQSPRLNRTIALAYVRSAWAVPNTSVDVTTESGTHKAQVVQLPFEV